MSEEGECILMSTPPAFKGQAMEGGMVLLLAQGHMWLRCRTMDVCMCVQMFFCGSRCRSPRAELQVIGGG